VERIIVNDTGLSPVLRVSLNTSYEMLFTMDVPAGSAASNAAYEELATRSLCTQLNASFSCAVALSDVPVASVNVHGDPVGGGTLMHHYTEHLGSYEYIPQLSGRRLSEQAMPALWNTSQLATAANILAAECGTAVAWPDAYYAKRYIVAAEVLLDVAPDAVSRALPSGNELASSISLESGGCALCSDPAASYPPSLPPAYPPSPISPPPSPSPREPPPVSPPLTPPPPMCNLGRIGGAAGVGVDGFALITRNDATIASHTHYGAIAVGGTLYDSTPTQHGTIAGVSYVNRQEGESRFTFESVVRGRGMPFDWELFERLAATLEASGTPLGRERIHVVCSGGVYDFSQFCADCPGSDHDSPSGANILVVFNTHEEVTLRSTVDGRQWYGSVLAPFSRVVVDGGIGFVDGIIIARSYASWDGSGQLHARCFHGFAECNHGHCTSARTDTRISGAECHDVSPVRECLRKAQSGKCTRQRIRAACAHTCHVCN